MSEVHIPPWLATSTRRRYPRTRTVLLFGHATASTRRFPLLPENVVAKGRAGYALRLCATRPEWLALTPRPRHPLALSTPQRRFPMNDSPHTPLTRDDIAVDTHVIVHGGLNRQPQHMDTCRWGFGAAVEPGGAVRVCRGWFARWPRWTRTWRSWGKPAAYFASNPPKQRDLR
jgi:hypothetical protein